MKIQIQNCMFHDWALSDSNVTNAALVFLYCKNLTWNMGNNKGCGDVNEVQSININVNKSGGFELCEFQNQFPYSL